MPLAARNLVLGAGYTYSVEQVSWFVMSLRRHTERTHAALLVDPKDGALIDFLRTNDVEPILLRDVPRWLPAPVARRRFSKGKMTLVHRFFGALTAIPSPGDLRRRVQWSLIPAFLNISNSRYWIFLQYLNRHRGRYDRILLSDVRDVVFQDDPFAGTPEDFLWIFEENANIRLGGDHSREWIKRTYGEEGFEWLRGRKIICSGTTMGTEGRMRSYLRIMVDEIARLTPRIVADGGFDQAIHIWLQHHGRLPVTEIKRSFAGPIATLAIEDSSKFQFDERGRMLNEDGTVISVLHQYDRHPSVAQRIDGWLHAASAR